MALRWVRALDHSPHMFSTDAEAEHDWLLFCGGWQVGRIHRPGGRPNVSPVYAWALTGQLDLQLRGESADLDGAKEQMIAAMRRWAVWAGVREEDGGGPIEPQWTGVRGEWTLSSAQFVVGRVWRPDAFDAAPDAYWQLLTSGPMKGPGPLIGLAQSVDEAKKVLLDRWREWLAWATLGGPAAGS
jgi:hypothetical protein